MSKKFFAANFIADGVVKFDQKTSNGHICGIVYLNRPFQNHPNKQSHDHM